MAKRKKPSRRERENAGTAKAAVSTEDGDIHDDKDTTDKSKNKGNHGMPRGSSNDETVHLPLRDTDNLFASGETIGCVTKNHCVPCAYKIGLFDVALDKDFCRQVPNQRPEQCPRLFASSAKTETPDNDDDAAITSTPLPAGNPMGYQPGMSVLTVGDGDFSFSLALARILFDETNNAATTTTDNSSLVATSYESEETLRRVYPNFEETLEELHRLGATTVYQVDATRLNETLFGKEAAIPLPQSKFHRICWNFPCTAIEKGQDGQNKEMEDNKQLVRKFVSSATPFLAKGCGEIHICHKTKPPFNQWKLEEVALEGCSEKSSTPISYAGRVVLDRALLVPYIPRKALDRKSFPCHDACVYIFQSKHTPTGTSTLRFEPTLPLQADEKVRSDNEDEIIHNPRPVTPSLILSLRTLCLRAQSKRNSKSKGSRYSNNRGVKRQKR